MLFQVQSKIYQSRHKSIIGNSEKRIQLQQSLEALKTTNGEHITKFLLETHCFATEELAEEYVNSKTPLKEQDFSDKCTSIDDYENKHVVYKNHLLGTIPVPGATEFYETLSSVRQEYLKDIIDNLNELFPLDFLQDLDIFDNREWKEVADVEEQFSDGKQKLANLCQFYGLTYTDDVYQSFIDLVKDLFQKETPWCEIKQSYPSEFWMTILTRRYQFSIHGTLASLIENAIVTPMGSAEAER